MTPSQWLLLLIPIAYLIGSIPFGLLVGWANGIDVRKAGSGNIGATNVGRQLGPKFFWIVYTLDMLKGTLPTLTAGFILHFHAPDRSTYCLWICVAFAAIFGHVFSLFLKFKGGKGVATSAGMLLGLWPFFTLPAVLGLTVAYLSFKFTRYVSVASMSGAVSLPLFYIALGLLLGWPILGDQLPLLIAGVVMALLILIKHRANIARLLAGTENRAVKTPSTNAG